jgi:hypothetical protein
MLDKCFDLKAIVLYHSIMQKTTTLTETTNGHYTVIVENSNGCIHFNDEDTTRVEGEIHTHLYDVVGSDCLPYLIFYSIQN